MSEDGEGILNRLRSVDDDINNLNINLPGGNATNLDNLDKDEVLRMINQQMGENDYDDDDQYDQDFEQDDDYGQQDFGKM